MSEVSVHENVEAEVINVTYYKHQPLEVIISPDHRSYTAQVYYEELLEAGDQVERPKKACAVYIDDVPTELVANAKKIILNYLAYNKIVVDNDTKFFV